MVKDAKLEASNRSITSSNYHQFCYSCHCCCCSLMRMGQSVELNKVIGLQAGARYIIGDVFKSNKISNPRYCHGMKQIRSDRRKCHLQEPREHQQLLKVQENLCQPLKQTRLLSAQSQQKMAYFIFADQRKWKKFFWEYNLQSSFGELLITTELHYFQHIWLTSANFPVAAKFSSYS